MLARVFEEAGLPTTSIVLIKEHAERVKPPRALFVPFPFGFALGKPDDPPFQHRVLAAALDLFGAGAAPVLAEFPEDAGAPARMLQAKAAQAEAVNSDGDAAGEITALRGYYERWLGDHDGRTAVGLCGVPQRRFRGLVRFLESYAGGEDAPYDDQPADIELPRFLRIASDDLKAFYMEARMCQRPDDRNNDLQRWFWSETATGRLLARVAERLVADGEERSAQGIAR